MCGIVGYISESNQGDLIRDMAESIIHRGPDSDGFYSHNQFHMGIRRLSIIDLETGDQPISNEDRTLWITFNGEIYNYKELAYELKSKGHIFRTHSDTETVIHAYEEYGEGFLEKLNGMFSFALYNQKNGKLIIARDRFGEKPLYYFRDKNIFIFASEIKALLKYKGIERRLNDRALHKYLTLRYVPTPETLFKDIYKLPAAHYIELGPGSFFIRRYWNISFHDSHYEKESDCVDHFRELFERSVRLRLRSDVPLGAYLSSGVDSTSIVAVARNSLDKPVVTYSIGCDSPNDELADAKITANLLRCDHHELRYDEKSFDLLEDIIWHLEEPIGDAHIIPTYMLAQSASENLKVALLGEGSDESLFGYPFHKLMYYETVLKRYMPEVFRRNILFGMLKSAPLGLINIFSPLPTALGGEGKQRMLRYISNMEKDSTTEKFICLTSLFQPHEVSDLIGNDKYQNTVFDSDGPDFTSGKDAGSSMKQLFLLQLKGWLQDNILLRHDKLAMAHSLETRAPFLDHNLVEFLVNIPINMKFRHGSDKYVLRNYVANSFNKKIAYRKKIPFFAPIERFSKSQKFKDLIQNLLADTRSGGADIFDKDIVDSLVKNANEDNFLATKKLMALIIFSIWRRKFKVSC